MINEPGDSGTYPASVRIPEDSDLSNSTILAAGFEDLADRTANLDARSDSHNVAMGSHTTKQATASLFSTNSTSNVLIDELVFAVEAGDKLEVLVGPISPFSQSVSATGCLVVRVVDGVTNNDHETIDLNSALKEMTIPVWHTVVTTGTIRIQLMHRTNDPAWTFYTTLLMANRRWCFAKISRPT